jgi:hypothetical protein
LGWRPALLLRDCQKIFSPHLVSFRRMLLRYVPLRYAFSAKEKEIGKLQIHPTTSTKCKP